MKPGRLLLGLTLGLLLPGADGPLRAVAAPRDQVGMFVAQVLGSTEDVWREIFEQAGRRYREPKLVLYASTTHSACIVAEAAMGPFYCPIDEKVYLDVAFFRQIERELQGCDAGSPACEFSYAYVIAHEVGHHVQKLLGIMSKVEDVQAAAGSRAVASQLAVLVELQADCLAGVWAHHSEKRLSVEPSDIAAALLTAAATGDDTLQKKALGHVVPDSFTHGTAEQRQRWFNNGFKGGTVASCNTFAAPQP